MGEQKKKQRCTFCHKPALILMECEACKHLFCIKDRLAEDHSCTSIQYWKETKPRMELPKIVPLKIDKV